MFSREHESGGEPPQEGAGLPSPDELPGSLKVPNKEGTTVDGWMIDRVPLYPSGHDKVSIYRPNPSGGHEYKEVTYRDLVKWNTENKNEEEDMSEHNEPPQGEQTPDGGGVPPEAPRGPEPIAPEPEENIFPPIPPGPPPADTVRRRGERGARPESHLDEVDRDVPTESGDESIGPKTEAIANFRIEDSEIGSAFLDRMAELSQERAENSPVGRWERFKYAIGMGGEKAAKFKAAGEKNKALERDREILVKREQKYREEARVLCEKVQDAMDVISDPNASAREIRKAHKAIEKLTVKAVRDRRYIDTGILADIKGKLGIEVELKEEQATEKVPVIREISHDYEEKQDEIANLHELYQTPEAFKALMAKIPFLAGVSPEDDLGEELGKFLAGRGSRPLRGLAESEVRTQLLLEKIDEITTLQDTKDWAEFNSMNLHIMLREIMLSKKAEASYKRELAREYRGAIRVHQMKKVANIAAKAVSGVAKKGLAKAVGVEDGESDMTVREIIENGDNLIAQALVTARAVPEATMLGVESIDLPIFGAESKVLSGFEALIKRSVRLDKWRVDVDERRGHASEARRQKTQVIGELFSAFMAIRQRKKERRDSDTNREEPGGEDNE